MPTCPQGTGSRSWRASSGAFVLVEGDSGEKLWALEELGKGAHVPDVSKEAATAWLAGGASSAEMSKEQVLVWFW